MKGFKTNIIIKIYTSLEKHKTVYGWSEAKIFQPGDL